MQFRSRDFSGLSNDTFAILKDLRLNQVFGIFSSLVNVDCSAQSGILFSISFTHLLNTIGFTLNLDPLN